MGEMALFGGQKMDAFGVCAGPHHGVAINQAGLFAEKAGTIRPLDWFTTQMISNRQGNVMNTELTAMSAPINIEELDYLTDLMLTWCHQNGRSMDDLLVKRHTILSRFRTGERRPELLFSDM